MQSQKKTRRPQTNNLDYGYEEPDDLMQQEPAEDLEYGPELEGETQVDEYGNEIYQDESGEQMMVEGEEQDPNELLLE
jgi:hypothetical protein